MSFHLLTASNHCSDDFNLASFSGCIISCALSDFCCFSCASDFQAALSDSSLNALLNQDFLYVSNAFVKSDVFKFFDTFQALVAFCKATHPIKASRSCFSFSLCKLSLMLDSQGT
jgi:hypothetical protein